MSYSLASARVGCIHRGAMVLIAFAEILWGHEELCLGDAVVFKQCVCDPGRKRLVHSLRQRLKQVMAITPQLMSPMN